METYEPACSISRILPLRSAAAVQREPARRATRAAAATALGRIRNRTAEIFKNFWAKSPAARPYGNDGAGELSASQSPARMASERPPHVIFQKRGQNMKTKAKQSMTGATRRFAGSIGRAPLQMLLMALLPLTAAAPMRADTVGRQFPLYVADGPNNVVLKVDSSGTFTPFAQIPFPFFVAVAPNGDVFVSSASGILYKVDSAGNINQAVPDILAPFATAFDNS